jgi:hypothetical protein
MIIPAADADAFHHFLLIFEEIFVKETHLTMRSINSFFC